MDEKEVAELIARVKKELSPEEKKEDKEEESVPCPYCGTKLTSEADFCPKCGEELDWK